VEEISTLGLNADQEALVRKTYFEALRMVWIMVSHRNIATRCCIAVFQTRQCIYANGMFCVLLVCGVCRTSYRPESVCASP
jgi:hypothetical protein